MDKCSNLTSIKFSEITIGTGIKFLPKEKMKLKNENLKQCYIYILLSLLDFLQQSVSISRAFLISVGFLYPSLLYCRRKLTLTRFAAYNYFRISPNRQRISPVPGHQVSRSSAQVCSSPIFSPLSFLQLVVCAFSLSHSVFSFYGSTLLAVMCFLNHVP